MVDDAALYREQLIETALEADEDLLMEYLEGEVTPTEEQIKACIRKGTNDLLFFPTFCGSAFKNKGMQLVLDAVVDYLPSPTEVKPQPLTDEEGEATGEFAIVDTNATFKALAFKIMDDRFGALTFIRIYSGTLKKGDTILNSFTGKTERVGRMVEMQADDRTELSSAQAGDILAIVGMKNVQTGHTLCDPKDPCTLEAMVFPAPVISISVTPKDKGGSEKMGVAIGKMVAEDPTFQVETDQDSGETILRGMGELHLDIKVDILKRTYGVDLEVGKPQVAYRETITSEIEDSYTHKKQSGGSGQFGKIDYRIKPGEPGSGFVFNSVVVGGNVPKEFFPAIEKGFKGMMENGVLAGFPVLDVEIELYDGGFHAVDSSAVAFELAARGAFRQSIPKAGAQLIEPIMAVDVFTPDDHVGDVIGDLNRRRGMIAGQEAGVSGVRIKADVPLSEMFGYIGSLRTMTSGRGQFSMEFSHYMPCPNNVAEEVIAEVKAAKAAKDAARK
jgi:elongation factor G